MFQIVEIQVQRHLETMVLLEEQLSSYREEKIKHDLTSDQLLEGAIAKLQISCIPVTLFTQNFHMFSLWCLFTIKKVISLFRQKSFSFVYEPCHSTYDRDNMEKDLCDTV